MIVAAGCLPHSITDLWLPHELGRSHKPPRGADDLCDGAEDSTMVIERSSERCSILILWATSGSPAMHSVIPMGVVSLSLLCVDGPGHSGVGLDQVRLAGVLPDRVLALFAMGKHKVRVNLN
jgi:hypothetical protein